MMTRDNKTRGRKALGNNKTLGGNKTLGSKTLPGSGKTSQAIQRLVVMLKRLQHGTTVEAVNMSKGGIAARPNRVLAMVRNCKAWRNNRRARTAFRLRWSIASSPAKAAAIRARSVAAITA